MIMILSTVVKATDDRCWKMIIARRRSHVEHKHVYGSTFVDSQQWVLVKCRTMVDTVVPL